MLHYVRKEGFHYDNQHKPLFMDNIPVYRDDVNQSLKFQMPITVVIILKKLVKRTYYVY